MQRNPGIDNIRIFLIALVIIHHAAIAYGGSGGWYWREIADSSNTWLVALNCIDQSFFMGLFFLLSGYYTKASLGRKSLGPFLLDRGLRLGVPLVLFFFLLNPLTIALAISPTLSTIGETFGRCLRDHNFGPGPLWFVWTLILMTALSLIAEFLSRHRLPTIKSLPTFSPLLAILLAIGAISFCIRLWVPVGKNVLWMQLGYFAPYIFLYAVGFLSFESRLLERISLRQCLPWFGLSSFALITLAYVFTFGLGKGSFHGGWNVNALYYAFWDPLFSCGVILGLLWGFQAYWNHRDPKALWLSKFFARRSYAIFILHAPVLVALSRTLHSFTLPPELKLLIAASASFIICSLIASLLLKIPGVAKVI